MKLRNPWMIRLAAWSTARLVRTAMSLVRVRIRALDGREHPADPDVEPLIYACWHEALLLMVRVRTRVRVLISTSADGELIAQACRRLGYETVRGSSARGGTRALLKLVRTGRASHALFTLDGPRGPRRQAQPGAVYAASRTGMPIAPVGFGFTRAWRARSWDRFAVPLPGSLVTVVIAPSILVPIDADLASLRSYGQKLQAAMESATAAAETWAGELAARRRGSAPHDREDPPAARAA